jgi:hypothetical protein
MIALSAVGTHDTVCTAPVSLLPSRWKPAPLPGSQSQCGKRCNHPQNPAGARAQLFAVTCTIPFSVSLFASLTYVHTSTVLDIRHRKRVVRRLIAVCPTSSHACALSGSKSIPNFFPDRHPRRSKPARGKPEARKKRVLPFLKSPKDLSQLHAHRKSRGRLIRARTWPYV